MLKLYSPHARFSRAEAHSARGGASPAHKEPGAASERRRDAEKARKRGSWRQNEPGRGKDPSRLRKSPGKSVLAQNVPQKSQQYVKRLKKWQNLAPSPESAISLAFAPFSRNFYTKKENASALPSPAVCPPIPLKTTLDFYDFDNIVLSKNPLFREVL